MFRNQKPAARSSFSFQKAKGRLSSIVDAMLATAGRKGKNMMQATEVLADLVEELAQTVREQVER
jgi:hypothetical protein